MRNCRIFIYLIFFSACFQKSKLPKEVSKVNTAWLDSIRQKSDTSWTKPYRNNEFVTAEYYVNRKDSIVTQLMKDGKGQIRQINIARYDNIRLFFGEYYANGQLKAKLPLNAAGKYDGEATYYYEDGSLKSIGAYNNGLYAGEWRNYSEKGKLVSTDHYDSNGQLVRSQPAGN